MSRQHTSPMQFEIMVAFMERNGDLCKPKDSARGKVHTAELWEELVQQLNSNGSGHSKSLDKWKKVWSDLKSYTKKKAAKINREAHQTGGGPAYEETLSDIELRVLIIIGVKSAVGLDVSEVGIEQEDLPAGAEILLPDTPLLKTIPVAPGASIPTNGNEEWDKAEPSNSSTHGGTGLTPTTSQQATAASLRFTSPERTPLQCKRDVLSPPGQQRKRIRLMSKSNSASASALFLRSDEAFRAHETKRLQLEERRLALEERRLHLEEGWQRLADKFFSNQAEQLDVIKSLINNVKP